MPLADQGLSVKKVGSVQLNRKVSTALSKSSLFLCRFRDKFSFELNLSIELTENLQS